MNKIIEKTKQYINNENDIFSFMNGKNIGINFKIMLKYIKISLGKDLNFIGIVFILLGFLSSLSTSFTIISLTIINDNAKEQKNQSIQTILNNANNAKNQIIPLSSERRNLYIVRENQTSISKISKNISISIHPILEDKKIKEVINF